MNLNPINASVAIARGFFESHSVSGDIEAFNTFFVELFRQSPDIRKATQEQIEHCFNVASVQSQGMLDPDFFCRFVFDLVSRSAPIDQKDILKGLFMSTLIDSFRLNDQDQEPTELVEKARDLAVRSGLVSRLELDQEVPILRAIHEFASADQALAALENTFS